MWAECTCASRPRTRRPRDPLLRQDGSGPRPLEEKKVERLYFRGEFRRAFLDEVGDIIYPPRALEYYTAGLDYAMKVKALDDGWLKVIADFSYGVASIVLPAVASGWHMNLVALNPFLDAEQTTVLSAETAPSFRELRGAVELMQADFGVRFDAAGERISLLTPSGKVLDGDTALHAMVDLWCRTDGSRRPIAVPLASSLLWTRSRRGTGTRSYDPVEHGARCRRWHSRVTSVSRDRGPEGTSSPTSLRRSTDRQCGDDRPHACHDR